MSDKKEEIIRNQLCLNLDSLVNITERMEWTQRNSGVLTPTRKYVSKFTTGTDLPIKQTEMHILNAKDANSSGIIISGKYISPIISNGTPAGYVERKIVSNSFERIIPTEYLLELGAKIATESMQSFLEEHIINVATEEDFQEDYTTSWRDIDVKVTPEFFKEMTTGSNYMLEKSGLAQKTNIQDFIPITKALTKLNIKVRNEVQPLEHWLTGLRKLSERKIIEQHKLPITLNKGNESYVLITDMVDQFEHNGITVGYGLRVNVKNPIPEFNEVKNEKGEVIVTTNDFTNNPTQAHLLLSSLQYANDKSTFFQPESTDTYIWAALSQDFIDIIDKDDKIYQIENYIAKK